MQCMLEEHLLQPLLHFHFAGLRAPNHVCIACQRQAPRAFMPESMPEIQNHWLQADKHLRPYLRASRQRGICI